MKWEPLAAMVALFLLGMWVVYGPQISHQLRPGATTAKYSIGGAKGELEVVPDPGTGQNTFRFLPSHGKPTQVISEPQLRALLGDEIADRAINLSGNLLFRFLNITSWASFFWLSIGFVGQMLFMGRMLIQWLVSEKQRQVRVPLSFWWFSLIGGVMLFTYFAWRQDPIGVLGQTTGVVIYARNIRLIHKQNRRAGRGSPEAASADSSAEQPAGAGSR